jgi:hypothetical protein
MISLRTPLFDAHYTHLDHLNVAVMLFLNRKCVNHIAGPDCQVLTTLKHVLLSGDARPECHKTFPSAGS